MNIAMIMTIVLFLLVVGFLSTATWLMFKNVPGKPKLQNFDAKPKELTSEQT